MINSDNIDELSVDTSSSVSLYVVKNEEGTFFGGYNATAGASTWVESELKAKKFTNKYDIKLRPNEVLVELVVNLEEADKAGAINVSEPFRPRRFPRKKD